MTIKIYTISGAPRPWRVLLGLAFKHLDYECVLLEGSIREHKKEPFLAINPRGTVPVLIEGDVRIADSIGALAWLDRAHPERPLFGSTTSQAAVIWQLTKEFDDYLRSATDRVLRPVFFEGAQRATPELLQSAESLRAEWRALATALGESPFLSGQEPGAADAVAFPEVRLIQRARDTHAEVMQEIGADDLYDCFPEVATWAQRIEALPGYDATRPPHWQVGP